MGYEILIFFGVILIFGYIWYANIIMKRNKVLEALSSIDVHLNMRFDLIPNILKIAKKFMSHEKELLDEITRLRTGVEKSYDRKDGREVEEHLTQARQLSEKVSQLMITVENYPDLKSDQTMVQAMQTYNEVEGRIAAARRFYNASVTDLNNSIQIFPGSFLANLAGVTEMPFLEFEAVVKAPVNVDQYLN
ncbi:MAG: LemA family protein [Methyloligellaceae bacterium]